jgi:hypothetical protein
MIHPLLLPLVIKGESETPTLARDGSREVSSPLLARDWSRELSSPLLTKEGLGEVVHINSAPVVSLCRL